MTHELIPGNNRDITNEDVRHVDVVNLSHEAQPVDVRTIGQDIGAIAISSEFVPHSCTDGTDTCAKRGYDIFTIAEDGSRELVQSVEAPEDEQNLEEAA